MQYGFDCKEHPIDVKPHGNTTKRDTTFKRTKPSTLKLVKQGVKENKRPLKVLRDVENIQGGVMRAKSGCELPRDRRQIYNAKKAHKACAEGASVPDYKRDTLAQVMQMCKDTSSSTNAFVRSVEAAPEPMCVLATDQQLCDLARFCLGNPSSVLSIDHLQPRTILRNPNHLSQLVGENKEWKSPNNAWSCFDTPDKDVPTLSLFCIYSDSTQFQTSRPESIWYRW